MKDLFVLGAGNIGSLIVKLFDQVGVHHIIWGDQRFDHPDCAAILPHLNHTETVTVDLTDPTVVASLFTQKSGAAVVSCLPYFCNVIIAEQAHQHGLHYFDLTEDTQVTARIRAFAQTASTAFVGQCGLAPGLVNLIAETLIKDAEGSLEEVNLRVGALPKTSHHVLKYALNWSIEGLINEYAEPCQVLIGGKVDSVPALSECEAVTLDGQVYEAFQTSGGLAYMAERYAGKINALNYKTLRYPGHCQRMRFLMQDLGLNADRPTLAKLLKRSLPKNTDDKVLLYVTVRSRVGEVLRERTHFQTFYPQTIGEQTWSAIQVTTAASLCAVVEQVLLQPEAYSGWIEHHCFDYLALMTGSFGRYLAPDQA